MADVDSKATPPTTQRAYTLRLNHDPGECPSCKKADCGCWRDALWATHEAVNRGAKAFGDWLLTHIVEQLATNCVMGGGGRG